MIRFACTSCKTPLGVPDDKGGRKARCPKCGSLLVVPAAASAAGMRWLAVSTAGVAEEAPPPQEKLAPLASGNNPRAPIDYTRIVLDVLRAFGGPGGVSFRQGVPAGAGAGLAESCALTADQPDAVLVDCVRSKPARTCVLFAPTHMEVHRCGGEQPRDAIVVPYFDFPARNFTRGRGVTEVSLDHGQAFDASGCSLPAATLGGVLRRIKNSIIDEQKARGEYAPPRPLKSAAGEEREDQCPRCGSTHTIEERWRTSAFPEMLVGGLLFGAIGGAIGAGRAGRKHFRCFDCGCEWRIERE